MKITIYDMLGREVKILVNEPKEPGNYEVRFDASESSSGVYFYKLLAMPNGQTGGNPAGDFVQTRKMILLM